MNASIVRILIFDPFIPSFFLANRHLFDSFSTILFNSPFPLQVKNIEGVFVRSCRPVLVRPDPNSAPFPILSERINGRKKSHVDIHDETTSSLLRVHRGKIRAVEGPRIKFFNNAIHRLERNHASKRSSRSKERWPSLALSRFSTLVLQFAGHAERGESRKERPPLPTLYEVSKTNFVAERSAT